MRKYLVLVLFMSTVLSSCKKSFLEAKPSSTILTPRSLADIQGLLDNSLVLNVTGALPQMSSDDYFIADQNAFDALSGQTYKNAYLWQKDIYSGETNIPDWKEIYTAVFYANSALDALNSMDREQMAGSEWRNLKGSALFFRSFALYDLARNFCPVYNESSADSDLGIPLKLTSGIDEVLSRSTLRQTYELIIGDLINAESLVRDDFSVLLRNRPSKTAVYAMLSRIYLSMGKYSEAEQYADKSLDKYNKLIDYNKVSTSSATPFSYSTDETIFYSNQLISYSATTGYNSRPAIGVDPQLYGMYAPNDLRLSIFFVKNPIGNYNVKRGYVGGGLYAFTGLATDEMILIKAECAARRNETSLAMTTLNTLLVNRYKTGTFSPLKASGAEDALKKILDERRKELIWRALRWSDLKRLNKEGAGIVLTRKLGSSSYTILPNSSLYTFPIPDDEIALSGIDQNIR